MMQSFGASSTKVGCVSKLSGTSSRSVAIARTEHHDQSVVQSHVLLYIYIYIYYIAYI